MPHDKSVATYRLKNGLQVVALPMHQAPVVAVQAWVHVGSADEQSGWFGAAHLHEHMLFKGTSKRGVGVIAQEIEASGGMINAWTSFDQTVYHVVMAKDELHVGLDVLSDALQHALFDADELAREIVVVQEEIRRAYDTPTRRISYALFNMAYPNHPYGRPVLGSHESVGQLSRSLLVDFFQQHYAPNNTTLVVVGDFQTDRLRPMVEALFGAWQPQTAKQIAPRPQEANIATPRVQILREDVKESHVSMAWHGPAFSDDIKILAAVDVLAVILGHGETSRLYNILCCEKKLVNHAYAYAYIPKDPGLITLGASFANMHAPAVIGNLLQEATRLCHEPVTQDELALAKVIILSEAAYQQETVEGMANKLGFFTIMAGSHTFEAAYRQAVEALGTEDITSVAKRYIHAQPMIVVQVPDKTEHVLTEADIADIIQKSQTIVLPKKDPLGVKKIVLQNGTTLLLRHEAASPVVSIVIAALGGQRLETAQTAGLHHLLATLWGQATSSMKAFAMKRAVALLGGQLGGFSGRNTIGLQGDFLQAHLDAGLQLCIDAWQSPVFDATDTARERSIVLERIRNRDDHIATATSHLFLKTLYPTHSYGLPVLGTEESVAKFTEQDVQHLWQCYMHSSKWCISVVGDIDVERIAAILAQHASQLQSHDHSNYTLPQSVPLDPVPTQLTQAKRHLAREQTHVLIGTQGTILNHPDRFGLDVLTTILSGQSGRLFLDLRDKQSLAYSISCSNTEGLDPGYIVVHLATSPEKVAQAMAGIYGHLARLQDDLVSEQELQRAKRYIIGSYAMGFQRASARAASMALNEAYGIGYAAYTTYPIHIEKVTAEEIRRLAQYYFKKDRLVETIVGAI